jgi:hypothetical protein
MEVVVVVVVEEEHHYFLQLHQWMNKLAAND